MNRPPPSAPLHPSRHDRARAALRFLGTGLLAAALLAACFSLEDPSDTATTEDAVLAPWNFVARATASSRVELSWAGSRKVVRYELRRGPSSASLSTLDSVSGSVTFYADTGVEPATTYAYQVVAIGRSGARA